MSTAGAPAHGRAALLDTAAPPRDGAAACQRPVG